MRLSGRLSQLRRSSRRWAHCASWRSSSSPRPLARAPPLRPRGAVLRGARIRGVQTRAGVPAPRRGLPVGAPPRRTTSHSGIVSAEASTAFEPTSRTKAVKAAVHAVKAAPRSRPMLQPRAFSGRGVSEVRCGCGWLGRKEPFPCWLFCASWTSLMAANLVRSTSFHGAPTLLSICQPSGPGRVPRPRKCLSGPVTLRRSRCCVCFPVKGKPCSQEVAPSLAGLTLPRVNGDAAAEPSRQRWPGSREVHRAGLASYHATLSCHVIVCWTNYF